MSKSMEDRTKRTMGVYLGLIGIHPILTKGGFKPGLKKACEGYDANIDAYEKQVKRKADLTKILDKVVTELKDSRDAVHKLNDARDKDFDDNIDLFHKSESDINDARAKGDKADPPDVVSKLKDFNQKFKKFMDQEKVHSDKKEKLGADTVANLKKLGDSYEKESKDIKSAIDKITAAGDSFDSQIRQLVAGYKKTATQMKDKQLVTDLDKMLAPLP